MSNSQRAEAAIQVDEHHTYEIVLGEKSVVTWKEGKVTVKVQIPYEKQRTYGKDKLGTMPNPPDTLDLGQVQVNLPDDPASPRTIPVTMPAGSNLPLYIKSCRQMLLPMDFPLPQPKNTLIDVQAEMFDGIARLERLLHGYAQSAPDGVGNHTDPSDTSLRLRLNLWAPDLLTRSPKAPGQELNEMLDKRENDRQIFLPQVEGDDAITELAQSLVALANSTSEGRILLGVARDGAVIGLPGHNDAARQEHVQQALLQATLHCKPHVPFAPPKYHEKDGKFVAVVEIKPAQKPPATASSAGWRQRLPVPALRSPQNDQAEEKSIKPYEFAGVIYRRKGNVTTHKRAPRPPRQWKRQPLRYLELMDVLKLGNCADVIVLNAGEGIDTLTLGPAISGLVNAGQKNGVVVLRNLPVSWTAHVRLEQLRWRLRQHLHAYLQAELAQCLPRMKPPAIRPVVIAGEWVAIIRLTDIKVPVMLYDGKAYAWTGRNLKTLSTDEVFTRYLKRNDQGDGKKQDKVNLVYGELYWPMQPPKSSRIDGEQQKRRYDAQRHAIIWEQQPFAPQPQKTGQSCMLTVPINQALMTIDTDGKVNRTTDPTLAGRLFVRFDDVTATDLGVKPQAGEYTGTWFNDLPIKKRTHLRLEFTVQAQELFKRRRRTSLLRFRVPDVTLDADRLADLQQIFTDLEFYVKPTATPHAATSPADWQVIRGVRNKAFSDIKFTAGVASKPTELARELHYEDRIDSKYLQTALTEIQVLLESWGEMDPAASLEMAQLHLDLYELISRRFQYLRTE
jgi:hypothetical protein